MQKQTQRAALTSKAIAFVAVGSLALSGAAFAQAAKPVMPAGGGSAEVEKLLADAAAAEKAEKCEAAYGLYKDAQDKASSVADKARSAELESIAQNKLDKLEDCYQACQPNGRQRGLIEAAKNAHLAGEDKRAVQITKKLLVGKNDKCVFWAGAKDFLRTLPNQADEIDNLKVDPCEVPPEVQSAMEDARRSVKKQQSQLAELTADKNRMAGKLPELIDLYQKLDSTRQRIFELREEYLDCDSVYKPLVEDAGAIHDAFTSTQGAILGTYKKQLDGLTSKIRAAQAQIAERNKLLETKASEQERLQKQFDEMGSFNEELYNDLFTLAGSEAISFSTTIEGRRIEKPLDEIKALVADEGKVISTLEQKYPEYFTDGVHVEGLKRKKLVLEKIGQMLQKYSKTKALTSPGYQRAVDEVDATVKMLDKVIAKQEAGKKPGEESKGEGGGVPTWLVFVGGLGLAGAIAAWRIRSSMNK